MERFDELMAGFLEGQLTADEQDELVALVRGDPSFRHRFAALAEVDGLLWGHFVPAAAREELISRTMLCLPDAQHREQTVQRVMERIAEPTPGLRAGQDARATANLWRVYLADWRLWAAAAGILLVLAAAVYQALGRGSIEKNRQELIAYTGAAKLDACTGRVSILTEFIDAKVPAQPPQALAGKNGLDIDGPGRATIKYWDKTVVRLIARQNVARAWLGGTANMPLLGKRDSFGKRFTLEAGILDADVARQPAGDPMILSTPHAEVLVLGTRFRLTVTVGSTRLDVYEGSVKMTRRGDEKSVVVAAKNFAIAGSDVELKAAPGAVEPAREEP